MTAVVVAGEALIDLVPRPDGSLEPRPGGGPFNVARMLGRLGVPAAFLGRLSTDPLGRRLREELEGAGVDTALVQETGDPTTLALAEPDGYRFYLEGTSAPGLRPVDLEPEVLCVGALGLAVQPMASVLEALAERARFLAVDPNVRPAVHRDTALLRRVIARADLLKASDEDLALLAPGADPVTAARSLAPLTFVTRGARGALVVTADDVVEVPAPQVEIVTTIGAGDAFMAGLLARRDAPPADAARFACEVAASALQHGAVVDPPRP